MLRLLARGLSNEAIGARLGRREQTVKNRVHTLTAKPGLEGRTQVALYYWGL